MSFSIITKLEDLIPINNLDQRYFKKHLNWINIFTYKKNLWGTRVAKIVYICMYESIHKHNIIIYLSSISVLGGLFFLEYVDS